MTFLILLSILAIVGLVAFFGAPLLVDPKASDGPSIRLAIRAITGVVFLVIFVPLIFFTSVHRVPAGHEAVVFGLGGDITGQRPSGFQFTLPWQSVEVVSTQRQSYRPANKCSNGQDQCLEAFSKDNQDVFVSVTLNYHIDQKNIQELLRNNPNYVDRTIRPRVNQFVKDETVKYGSTEVAANRDVIRAAVTARLTLELAAAGIGAEDFFIDNIDFQQGFKDAIEQKVKAEQDALTETNRVAVSEAQAKQVAATALGAANALRITAQGQADANDLVNKSLTPALIQYAGIQKLNDKINVMLVPASGNILFDPTKLVPATAP